MADTGAALASGDFETLTRAAHTLKGSLRNFAAKEAHEAALALETAARQVNLGTAQEAWALLTIKVGELQSALNALVHVHVNSAQRR